jgi:hypothetical protein
MNTTTAALPLIRALDKFATNLALVGRGLSGRDGVGSTAGAIGGMASKIPGVGAAAATVQLGMKLPVAGSFAKLGLEGMMLPLRKIMGGFSALMLPLTKMAAKAEVMAAAFNNAGKASYAYSDAIGNSTQNIAGAAKSFMDSFSDAMTSPMSGLPALVGAVRPFVEAFNPYVLHQFDDAMRSVYAVIGEALVPVVKVAAQVLREFAGYLRPVMKQLQPIFEQMARQMGDFLKDLIPELARFAEELVPMFRLYLQGLKDAVGGQKKMMAAGLLWATGQISTLEMIKRGIIQWLSTLPYVGKYFKVEENKASKAADDLEFKQAKGKVAKEEIFSFGAPTSPQFKSADSLGRDTLQAAYAAMPNMDAKNEQLAVQQDVAKNTGEANDLLKDIIDVLKSPWDQAVKFGSDTARAFSSVQGGADVYDERLAAAKKPGAGYGEKILGGSQWAAGQLTEGVYNFGVGVGNLFSGRKLNENMVDI